MLGFEKKQQFEADSAAQSAPSVSLIDMSRGKIRFAALIFRNICLL